MNTRYTKKMAFILAASLVVLLPGCGKEAGGAGTSSGPAREGLSDTSYMESGNAESSQTEEPTTSTAEDSAPSAGDNKTTNRPGSAGNAEGSQTGKPAESSNDSAASKPNAGTATPELPSVFNLSQADKDGLVLFENMAFSPQFLTYLVYQNPDTRYEIKGIKVDSITVDNVSAEFRQADGNGTLDDYDEQLRHYHEDLGVSFDRNKATNIFTLQCPDRVREKAACVRSGIACDDGSCAVSGVIKLRLTLSGYSGELPYTYRFNSWRLCSHYGGEIVLFESYK